MSSARVNSPLTSINRTIIEVREQLWPVLREQLWPVLMAHPINTYVAHQSFFDQKKTGTAITQNIHGTLTELALSCE